MSEGGTADRSRLLRSKKAELSVIVKSRKRKLREFFAVCDNGSPIPQLDVSNPDTPPTNSAEALFLEATDILQDRLFDESNLPVRRQIVSDNSKSTLQKLKTESTNNYQKDASRNVGKFPGHDTKPTNPRGSSPKTRNSVDGSTNLIENQADVCLGQGLLMKRLLLKNSRTSLPAAAAVGANATKSSASVSNVLAPLKKSGSNVVNRFHDKQCFTSTDTPATSTASIDDNTQISKDSSPSPTSCEYIIPEQSHTINTSPRVYQTSATRKTDKPTHHDIEIAKNPRADGISPHQSLKLISSQNSIVDTISDSASKMHDASTETSADIEGNYDADKKRTKDEGSSSFLKQKTSRVDKNHALQYEKLLKSNGNIPRTKLVADKSNSLPGQSFKKKVNGLSVNEQHSKFSRSLVKRSADEGLGDIDVKGNLADDMTIKNTTIQTPVVQGVEPKNKSFRIKRGAGSKDLSESNVSNEAAHIISIVPSKRLQASEDLLKSSDNSNSDILDPLAHLKPISIVSNPERRNTRIGSGVLERKSVSDIIGDTQPISGSNVRSFSKPESDPAKISYFPPRSATPQSSVSLVRTIPQKQKDKGRSKLSNLIFSNKPVKVTPKSISYHETDAHSEALREDYFTPLFLANASTGKGSIPSLDSLLATTQKTITTSNSYVPIYENQTAKILKRIYNLQSSHKWSLRQPKRSIEPIRPKTHWDSLIQEALWMRTDFKEERKWKRAVARTLAFACAEWVSSCQKDRKLLQVKASLSKPFTPNNEDQNDLCNPPNTTALCDEIKSLRDSNEKYQANQVDTSHPTIIFGQKENDVLFCLKSSEITDKLLNELPIYGMPLEVPNPIPLTLDFDPDRFWKRPALPLSKYVEGKMRLKLDPLPRKKSRYEYEEEDEEDEEEESPGEERTKKCPLPPESTEVALFDPRYRHILERIRNLNCFRPPSESQMPLQSFFECRTASQWTWDEDKELKGLVREYTYNWSLISSILSGKSKSDLATGAERRTPWECFERWIELEGLPGDMQKTYYFRLYTSRIENANRNIMALQPTQNAQGQIQQARKRSTASIRVDRRRNQKYLVLIDTMRKLAKKRETMIQKQHNAASIAAMRKSQETPHAVNRSLSATTPQDFSRLKHERDQVVKERFLQLQQRQEAQRRAVLAQRSSGASQHQSGLTNFPRPSSGPSTASNLSNSGNQNRPLQVPSSTPSHSLSSSVRVASMGLNSVPQAPMQSQMQTSSSLDAGLVSRAHAISQHQHAILRQQKKQHQNNKVNGQPSHSPRMNGISISGYSMQANMVPPFSSDTTGISTNSTSPLSSSSHGDSRRVGQSPPSITHVQRMEIQYKAKYPGATHDQIASMISQVLAQSLQQRQNLSQTPATGIPSGSASNANNLNGSQANPEVYSLMLHHQQETQNKQQRNSPTGGNFQPNLSSSSVNRIN